MKVWLWEILIQVSEFSPVSTETDQQERTVSALVFGETQRRPSVPLAAAPAPHQGRGSAGGVCPRRVP